MKNRGDYGQPGLFQLCLFVRGYGQCGQEKRENRGDVGKDDTLVGDDAHNTRVGRDYKRAGERERGAGDGDERAGLKVFGPLGFGFER